MTVSASLMASGNVFTFGVVRFCHRHTVGLRRSATRDVLRHHEPRRRREHNRNAIVLLIMFSRMRSIAEIDCRDTSADTSWCQEVIEVLSLTSSM